MAQKKKVCSFEPALMSHLFNLFSVPKGEFDDLISALRTGDVFGEDMAKLKRTRRKLSTPSASVETVRERVGSKS
jgi:hypothetical protein